MPDFCYGNRACVFRYRTKADINLTACRSGSLWDVGATMPLSAAQTRSIRHGANCGGKQNVRIEGDVSTGG
jgi:hypothetical protein